ncbi:hypothetical protein GSI_03999 [Ganoderma sinense ZZ0214-1]|uniref:Protein kinase domain-containing protein n=1 Tax=Ganoderma sinense ZZ0214-1 TaxID=1077348 RepID=A0A2G8SHY0_9APHY|nr:hypothetical protein GSI_03999 [Ganoderma sinense ZZ0214-1]
MVGRDIILKVIQKDSPQHHIFQTLLQHQSLFTDPRTFPGVLPPIDIIETPHKYSIVTMPLWGTYPCLTEMEDVRQVLTFIRCLLEGLSFLHANRIAHRDICDSNMVVSCYRPDRDQKRFGGDLRELRRGTDIRYAFMDYDQSIQLPLDVSVKHCRRPSREAWMGCDMYKPLDVSLGESQYNPFAFDVAMLGNMFRAYLSEAIPTLPALAALFDGMTTHVVSRRFSADEALDFFKSNIQLLPQEVLVAPVTLEFDYEMMYHPERYWSKLAPPVQARWNQFRAPPLPRWWHFLNWLMQLPACTRVVEWYCDFRDIPAPAGMYPLPFNLILKNVPRVREQEGLAMNLARAMGVPAPRFISFAEPPPDYYFSDGIEPDDQVDFDVIKDDLVHILTLMRSFSSPWGSAICGVDGGPVAGPLVPLTPLQASPDEAAFYQLMRHLGSFELKDKNETAGAEKFFALPPHAIVFTHGDLNRHNIMVGPDGHITGIIDWEAAAWLPDYWEVSVTAILPQRHWGRFMNETVTSGIYAEEVVGHREMFSFIGDSLRF